MTTSEEAAIRWPHALRVITKAEREFRRQQEYWKTGAKRATKWLKK